MAEYSRFFGGPEGEIPKYNQTHDAEVYRLMFTSGVFSGILNELEVVECDPVALAIRIKTGWAYVHGFWYHNTALLTKSLATADPDNPRIDRIILRLDTVTNFKISAEVLTGTPAAEPSPPELTQTDTTYEISLAQVLVGANVTSVSNANITDEREYVIGVTRRPPKTYTPSAAGTVTLDLSLSREHRIIMPAGNITIVVINEINGQIFKIDVTQDAVGSRTVTWFDTIKWADGSAPTLTTTANKRDTFGIVVTGAGTYDGFIIGLNI
ncbi:hypothetical protein ES707_10668 [subsurface metagenome]